MHKQNKQYLFSIMNQLYKQIFDTIHDIIDLEFRKIYHTYGNCLIAASWEGGREDVGMKKRLSDKPRLNICLCKHVNNNEKK